MSHDLTISFPDGRRYPVLFRPLTEAPARMAEAGLRAGRCLVVTDEHVAGHYAEPVTDALRAAGWTPRLHVVPAGEASKSAARLGAIYDDALGWGVDRRTPVVALGGGVVGDLAGFAAATLLRGLPLVHLPTSLVAQVDSALGGKTGINHAAGKNLVGAFHQPRLVLADTDTLHTLPQREWTSGLAEVVKHALIDDAAFADDLSDGWDAVAGRDADAVARLVPRAAAVKARIVAGDEREAGRRALLNFGHTFGHAIEREAGYGTFTHGEAVALGMRAAIRYAAPRQPALDAGRADALAARIPVPAGLAALPVDALVDAMQTDKKTEAGRLRLVLLRRIGEAYVDDDVDPDDVRTAWRAVQQLAG